jgi:DNA-binding NarL/FixJ family response regulator
MIAVGLVGNEDFRARAESALRQDPGITLVALDEEPPAAAAPDVVVRQVVDVKQPAAGDEMAGSAGTIVCIAQADLRATRRFVDGGADGVVWLERLDQSLTATIHAVAAGQICVPRDSRRRLHRPELTNREKQVLGLVLMGMSNADIAGRLFVTEATVKSHLTSAFRKLGVNSRAEAARVVSDPSEGLGTGILSIT